MAAFNRLGTTTCSENQVSRNEDLCPECHSLAIDLDLSRGERVCSDCGLVLEENLIDGDDPSRYQERSDSTIVSDTKDFRGVPLANRVRQRFRALQRRDRERQSYDMATYQLARFQENIEPLLCTLYGYSSVQVEACREVYLELKAVNAVMQTKHKNITDKISGRGMDSSVSSMVTCIVLAMEFQRDPTPLEVKRHRRPFQYSTRKGSVDVMMVLNRFHDFLKEEKLVLNRPLCEKSLEKLAKNMLLRLNRMYAMAPKTDWNGYLLEQRNRSRAMLKMMFDAVCGEYALDAVCSSELDQIVDVLLSDDRYPQTNAINQFTKCNAMIVHRYLRAQRPRPGFSLTFPKVLSVLQNLAAKGSSVAPVSTESPPKSYRALSDWVVQNVGVKA